MAFVFFPVLGCTSTGTSTSPEHRVYLLTSLDTDSGAAGTALGVDLDGVVSTGEGPTCVDQHGDFLSTRDPGVAGVDNAFVPGVAQAIVRGRCGSVPDFACSSRLNRAAILAGEILWAVEVVGPLDADGEVAVTLHRVSLGGGAAPIWVEGHLAPETVVVLEPVTRSSSASVVDGELHATFEDPFEPELFFGGDEPRLRLRLERVVLVADIGPDSLAAGVLGGVLRVTAALAELERVMPGSSAETAEYVDPMADLDPDPRDPMRCLSLAVGLGFSAVALQP